MINTLFQHLVSSIDRVLLIMILLIVGLAHFAPPVMIDVEIYASGDPEVYYYCATGTLAPPARHVGSGAVPSGQESYC